MRPFSSATIRSILALDSQDAFILLMTLIDNETSNRYYAALNTQDIVSRGIVFTASYFEFIFPSDSDEAPTGCQVTIDNVDLRLVDLLRRVTKPIGVIVELVVAARPDQVEMQITDLLMREISWDASTIQGTLVSDDPLNARFPSDIYEPRTFGGLF